MAHGQNEINMICHHYISAPLACGGKTSMMDRRSSEFIQCATLRNYQAESDPKFDVNLGDKFKGLDANASRQASLLNKGSTPTTEESKYGQAWYNLHFFQVYCFHDPKVIPMIFPQPRARRKLASRSSWTA